jgi:hypothetical protein
MLVLVPPPLLLLLLLLLPLAQGVVGGGRCSCIFSAHSTHPPSPTQ